MSPAPRYPAHILPPVFEQIVADDALGPRHLTVWRRALPYLDWVEPRALKLEVLARETTYAVSEVSRLVGILVDRGYLVRAGRDPSGGAWRYRVPLARAAAPLPSGPADDAPALAEPDGAPGPARAARATRRRVFSRGV